MRQWKETLWYESSPVLAMAQSDRKTVVSQFQDRQLVRHEKANKQARTHVHPDMHMIAEVRAYMISRYNDTQKCRYIAKTHTDVPASKQTM